MPELIEEQQEQGFDLQRYLNVVRRRHMQFLIPFFFGWLVVWGSSWFLQARYKSATSILVAPQTMPKNYVLPNVNDDLQERLQSIKQQVLSRSRLLEIIDKYHLYAGGHRELTPDEKVASMGKDISIELVQDQRSDQISAFSISYTSNDPHMAQAVASELTDQFINENSTVRLAQSQNTTDFMKQQVQIAAQKLADQEAKVRAFQATHEGALPTQVQTNLQILSGLQQQLQNAEDALGNAKQQREYIQAQITQYRNEHLSARSPDGTPTGLAAIDLQLEQLRVKLADLTSRYTDQYPDVVSTRDQIAKTEKRRAAAAAELSTKAATQTTEPETVTDPSIRGALLQLQAELHSNQMEVANREKAITELKGRINEYQARLNAEPATEQVLSELTRGYEQSKTDYDELFKKSKESEIATKVEELKQGERFTRLDPASLPTKPDFPNRLKFCGMGLGAGIGLGLLVLVALEIFDDRVHGDNEIKTLLPITILGEIPEVMTALDERKAKVRVWTGWATAALVMLCILAGSAFSYLRN